MRIGRPGVTSAVVLLALSSLVVAGDVVKLDGDTLKGAEARARQALASIAEGDAQVDTSQSFSAAVGGTRAEVLPVRYTPRTPGALKNVDHCAVVVLTAERVQVVPTIGTGYLESVGCTGLEAIAFPDLDGDGRHEIALIQSTFAPPSQGLKTPVVLRRNPDGDVAVDERLTRALDEQGGITTIAALRRAAQRLRLEKK